MGMRWHSCNLAVKFHHVVTQNMHSPQSTDEKVLLRLTTFRQKRSKVARGLCVDAFKVRHQTDRAATGFRIPKFAIRKNLFLLRY